MWVEKEPFLSPLCILHHRCLHFFKCAIGEERVSQGVWGTMTPGKAFIVVTVGHILGSLFRSTARSVCRYKSSNKKQSCCVSWCWETSCFPVQPAEDGFILGGRVPLSMMLRAGLQRVPCPDGQGCDGAS